MLYLHVHGNAVRKEQETITWYPEYKDFSIIDKAELGLTSMMKYLIIDGKIIFIVFTAIMAFYILKEYKSIFAKIIGIIPFIGATFFNIFKNFTNMLLPKLSELMSIYSKNELIIDSFDLKNITLFIPLLLYFVILLCILINIILIFKKEERMWIALFTYLLGLATRFIMGFSPTVFASGERPTLFLYYVFILISIMIYKKIIDKYNDKAEIIYAICMPLAILNLTNIL